MCGEEDSYLHKYKIKVSNSKQDTHYLDLVDCVSFHTASIVNHALISVKGFCDVLMIVNFEPIDKHQNLLKRQTALCSSYLS